METNDEVVERQKLVDVETEEDVTINVPKSVPTSASPINVPNINVKNLSNSDTTHSRNSVTCSIERPTIKSDKVGGGGTGSGAGGGGGVGVIDVGTSVCGSNTAIGCDGSGSIDGGGVGQTSAKVTYINERRIRPHLHGTADERFEFKTRPRKLLRDNKINEINDKEDFRYDNDDINQLNREIFYDDSVKTDNYYQCQGSQQQKQQEQKRDKNLAQLGMPSNVLLSTTTEMMMRNQKSGSNTIERNMLGMEQQPCQQSQQIKNYPTTLPLQHNHAQTPIMRNYRRYHKPNTAIRTLVSTGYSAPTLTLPLSTISKPITTTTIIITTTTTATTTTTNSMINQHLSSGVNDNFHERPIKHHSFVSEVPDVKHMERALLGLLDDFHSGKLKAFGSGCTMKQMTKIREQQESLAKLHFELAAAEEDALENSNDFNATKAQENMLQLMQRLEELSISIEQLQTSHTGL